MKLKEHTEINPNIDLTGNYNTRILTGADEMLVTGMRLDCEPAVWKSFERFQVAVNHQVSLVNCSRRGIDLLNKVLQNELHTIPIAARWPKMGIGDNEIGMIAKTHETMLYLEMTSTTPVPVEQRVASMATLGYKVPTHGNGNIDYSQMPDSRWMVTHRDEQVFTPAYAPTYYRFQQFAGVIMRVIFDGVPEPPQITIGPRMPTLIEANKIEPGAWLFDFTQDKRIVPDVPGRKSMRTLDTMETANIEACFAPPKEQGYVRVILQQVHLLQPRSGWFSQ